MVEKLNSYIYNAGIEIVREGNSPMKKKILLSLLIVLCLVTNVYAGVSTAKDFYLNGIDENNVTTWVKELAKYDNGLSVYKYDKNVLYAIGVHEENHFLTLRNFIYKSRNYEKMHIDTILAANKKPSAVYHIDGKDIETTVDYISPVAITVDKSKIEKEVWDNFSNTNTPSGTYGLFGLTNEYWSHTKELAALKDLYSKNKTDKDLEMRLKVMQIVTKELRQMISYYNLSGNYGTVVHYLDKQNSDILVKLDYQLN